MERKNLLLAGIVGMGLFLGGCQKINFGCMVGDCQPPEPKKAVAQLPSTVKTFYREAFRKEKRMILSYTYILTGQQLPSDKILLGPIRATKGLIPDNFDYYVDFKEEMGNILQLVVNSPDYTQVITGEVVAENLSNRSGSLDFDGEKGAGVVQGSAVGGMGGSSNTYRIRMSLTLTDAKGNVDSAVKNVIHFSQRNSNLNFAISFLNFSLGMSSKTSEQDSIVKSLQALSDFSLLQLMGKNYMFPYWFAFDEKFVSNMDILHQAREELFEKYYYKLFSRPEYARYFPHFLIMRRALMTLFGVPQYILRHDWYNRRTGTLCTNYNPLYRQQNCYYTLSKEEFTPKEQKIVDAIRQHLLSDNSTFKFTPIEKGHLNSPNPKEYIAMILVGINPLKNYRNWVINIITSGR
ncbi:MAG: hypothetical protein C6I01_04630 [Epsilonproteobacteria bacterium]|nr:hypothetical protein [Campylobacterota bacterium]NPA89478.1 hypothetical protein [Campylobacterota bacterium]